MSNISRHYEKSSPLPAAGEGSSPQKWYTDSGAALLSCVWVDLCGDFRMDWRGESFNHQQNTTTTGHSSMTTIDTENHPSRLQLRLMSKNTEKWSHHHHYHQQASTPSKETKRQFRWTVSKYWLVITTPILSWAVLAQLRMRIKIVFYATFYATLLGHLWKHFRIAIWLLTCDFCPQNLSLSNLFFQIHANLQMRSNHWSIFGTWKLVIIFPTII